MLVPVRLPLGGKIVRIEYVDELPDGDSGYAEPLSCLVRVSKSANRSAAEVLSTLLHEILHCALGLTGHAEQLKKRQEEAVVTALESMLAPLIVFNPAVSIKYREIEFPFETED